MRIPVCSHDEKIWSPVILTRWSDASAGLVEHVMPAPFCQKCADTLKAEDFLTDEIWAQCNRMVMEQGYPSMSRKFSQLRWDRIATVRQKFEGIQSGRGGKVLASEDVSPAEPSGNSGELAEGKTE